MNIRKKLIRDLVHRLLSENGFSQAPVDIEAIAQRKNAVVHRQPVDDEFSGYLFRDHQQSRAVIGVNSDHHVNRQRFTIAHELAHLLLHSGDEVHIDRRFVMMRRDLESSEGTSLEEMEANFFAAEILMPSEFLAEDIEALASLDFFDEDVIYKFSRKYRVSRQAMTIRLTSLGYMIV